MPSPLAVEVLADPTALPSVVDYSVSVSSRPLLARPLTAVPVPTSRQPPTGPAFVAPAPPLFTRSAAPARRNPQPAMRAGPDPAGPEASAERGRVLHADALCPAVRPAARAVVGPDGSAPTSGGTRSAVPARATPSDRSVGRGAGASAAAGAGRPFASAPAPEEEVRLGWGCSCCWCSCSCSCSAAVCSPRSWTRSSKFCTGESMSRRKQPSSISVLLHIPVFRRLWAAITISSLGDWLGLLATTSLAAYLTKEFVRAGPGCGHLGRAAHPPAARPGAGPDCRGVGRPHRPTGDRRRRRHLGQPALPVHCRGREPDLAAGGPVPGRGHRAVHQPGQAGDVGQRGAA